MLLFASPPYPQLILLIMFKIFSRPNNNNNSDTNTPPGSPSNKVIFADSFGLGILIVI